MQKKQDNPASEFTRLLNLFHKADRFTMKVIQKTLNAQARLHNSAVDFTGLWDMLGMAQMNVMDAKDANEAEKLYEDFDRHISDITRTITAMRTSTKAILNVRFPTRSNRQERSRY